MKSTKTKKKKFFRQNYFRNKKLGIKWRRPRGKQSKMRKSKKGKCSLPNIGYRTPDGVSGLVHGHRPVSISNPEDLKKITGNEIAVIASGVGLKKIFDISKKAEELGVKIYNTRKVRKAKRHFTKIERTREEKEKSKHVKKPEKEEAKHELKEKASEKTQEKPEHSKKKENKE